MKAFAALALSLGLVTTTAAQPNYPHVVEGSFIAPDGSRTLEQSIVIDAPAETLFRAYVEPREFARWNAPESWTDLRVGGTLEASYAPDARAGAAGNIRHRIVTYLPNRLIVLRNMQAPPRFPHPEVFQKTYIVVRYLPLASNRTRVSIALTGFGDTADDQQIEGFFRQGDAQLLEKMKAVYDGVGVAAGLLQPTPDRALIQSVEVSGDRACVWRQFTHEAAIRAQGIAYARVELKNDGLMEEGFEVPPKAGQTIRHRILTFIPGELMLLQNEQAPPGLPGAERYKQVVQVIDIAPTPTGAVRLTLAHTGYGAGGDWDKLHGFFESHNPSFLQQVKAACATKGAGGG